MMNHNTPVSHKDIVFFLELFASYCTFYFGEHEGAALYHYYYENYLDIIPAIKTGNACGEKACNIRKILSKFMTDIFFNKIETYYVKWPYDKGEIKQVDAELFDLKCFHFYESRGECKVSSEERIKLGFSRRALDLLLPPQQNCLFNRNERFNNNTAIMENLYAELKKRNPQILEEYGKNFWELTKNQFESYIIHRIKRTPQHLTNFLWYRIRED
jgi:hypothetical protein